MRKVFGFQQITLKPGAAADEFEFFVKREVFPTLSGVLHRHKEITHEFTRVHWMGAEQYLLKGSKDGEYLRVILADFGTGLVPSHENSTSDEVSKEIQDEVHREAQHIVSDIFGEEPRNAPGKMDSLVTKGAITTFIEVAQFT